MPTRKSVSHQDITDADGNITETIITTVEYITPDAPASIETDTDLTEIPNLPRG